MRLRGNSEIRIALLGRGVSQRQHARRSAHAENLHRPGVHRHRPRDWNLHRPRSSTTNDHKGRRCQRSRSSRLVGQSRESVGPGLWPISNDRREQVGVCTPLIFIRDADHDRGESRSGNSHGRQAADVRPRAATLMRTTTKVTTLHAPMARCHCEHRPCSNCDVRDVGLARVGSHRGIGTRRETSAYFRASGRVGGS